MLMFALVDLLGLLIHSICFAVFTSTGFVCSCFLLIYADLCCVVGEFVACCWVWLWGAIGCLFPGCYCFRVLVFWVCYLSVCR